MGTPVELSIEECLDLLAGGVVGRVALSTPVGPRIVPVNYAMYGEAVVVRTTPYSELGSYGWNNEVAFEIDHVDHETHTGWSVVLVGRAELVEDPLELRDIQRTWDPRPWASGTRNLYLKITWRDLTGRRIGNDWAPSTEPAARRVL